MKNIYIILCLFINYNLHALSVFNNLAVEFVKIGNIISSMNTKDNISPQRNQYIIPQKINPYTQQQNGRQYTHQINKNFVKQQPLTGIQLVRAFLIRNNIRITKIRTSAISPKGDKIAYYTDDNAFERIIITRNNSLDQNYNTVGRKEIVEKIVYTYCDVNGIIRARAVNLLNNFSIEIPSIKNTRLIKITDAKDINYTTITSYDNFNNCLACKINLNNFNIQIFPQRRASF